MFDLMEMEDDARRELLQVGRVAVTAGDGCGSGWVAAADLGAGPDLLPLPYLPAPPLPRPSTCAAGGAAAG